MGLMKITRSTVKRMAEGSYTNEADFNEVVRRVTKNMEITNARMEVAKNKAEKEI